MWVSVGQRAAKLQAVNIGCLKKKFAVSAITAEVCASQCGLGLSRTRSKSLFKFDGQ